MRKTNFVGVIMSLIFILGNVSFGQIDSKASNRKLRGDVGRLMREVKQSAGGAYIARFAANRGKTGLLFVPQKALWAKLSEAEKIALTEDWWRRWRVIRGAADLQIGFMSNADAEEIFCTLNRCHVPECAL